MRLLSAPALTAAACAILLTACDPSDPAGPALPAPSGPPSFAITAGTPFTDGTFDAADWTHTALATATAFGTTAQVSNGLGNPDPYRTITHVLQGTPTPSFVLTLHINESASYDPGAQGAIESVDHAEEARTIATEFNTWGGISRTALRQDGNVYVAGWEPTRDDLAGPLPSPWKSIHFNALTSSQYCLVVAADAIDCGAHPDFSAGGSVIHFGYARHDSHTFSFRSERTSAIDNWSVTVHSAVLVVAIDIKPGSNSNPISLRGGHGVIPVAVLSTRTAAGEDVDFDATEIDWSTVAFGPGGAAEAHGRGHVEDADGDGDLDMVFHFGLAEAALACGDTEASLTGTTTDGQAFRGSDTIRLLGCSP